MHKRSIISIKLSNRLKGKYTSELAEELNEKLYQTWSPEQIAERRRIKGKTYINVKVYFTDPYSSWQRGPNENGNDLLREFFPKRHDLAQVNDAELAYAVHLMGIIPTTTLILIIL